MGVSTWQGGISGAFHTSISMLNHSPGEHASSKCLSRHPARHQMETAAGPDDRAGTIAGPLEQVQCGVMKECRNGCCETEKCMHVCQAV